MSQEDKEVWNQVVGFDRYLVSSLGRVRSTYRSCKILSPKIDKDGYHEYGLRRDNKTYYRRGHRLVAEAFIANPERHPVINHKNNIPDDNRIENLEWTTVAYNTRHGVVCNNDNKTISHLSDEEILKIVKMYEEGYGQAAIKEYFGITSSTSAISEVLSGKRHSSVTGIIKDKRRSYIPEAKIEDVEVLALLDKHYNRGTSQDSLCKEYELSPAQVSRIINGTRRKKLYNKFMEGSHDKEETG